MTPRALATTLLATLTLGGCVLWPEGQGPNAVPMPLAEALARRDRGQAVLVDVRSRAAYDAGHIPGALSIPEDQVAARIGEIRKLGKLPIFYCG